MAYVAMHTSTHIHICIHTYIHIYMHTYIHIHIYTYVHTYKCINIRIQGQVRIHRHTYTYAYPYAYYIYKYITVHIQYIYINTSSSQFDFLDFFSLFYWSPARGDVRWGPRATCAKNSSEVDGYSVAQLQPKPKTLRQISMQPERRPVQENSLERALVRFHVSLTDHTNRIHAYVDSCC